MLANWLVVMICAVHLCCFGFVLLVLLFVGLPLCACLCLGTLLTLWTDAFDLFVFVCWLICFARGVLVILRFICGFS